MYSKRSEEKRETYKEEIKDKTKEDLVYIDESGINEFIYRDNARSKKGETVIGEVSGRKFQRISIVDAYCNGELLAPMTFTGTCTALSFNILVKDHLVPKLKPWQTVVMDNTSIHKGYELEKIIKDAGCTLLYLPPYSPDLNPIEHFWANLKRKIRSVMDKFDSLTEALKACYPCKNL